MRLLDRYQLRELLTAFGYCLLGILVFWMSFELLGEMDELRERNLGALDVAEYLLQRVPAFLLLQIPVTLMLALLYALTQHARHNELVAMRAAGIGLGRISLPYFAVGFVLSLVHFALNEFAVPDAAMRADAVLARGGTSAGDDAQRDWRRNVNFRDSFTGRTWSVGAFNARTGELRSPHIQWRAEDGTREELVAERATWDGAEWAFEGVTRFTFPPGIGTLPVQVRTNRLVMPDFPETPAHLRSEVKIGRLLGSLRKSRQVQLSLREIVTYRELHPRLEPRFEALLMTWFHDRLASPWTCLVVVLIAIPAGAGAGRRNVFVGVAATVFLAFGFFVLKEFSLALGSGDYVPPWLAAWMPNLVFGGAGILAMLRIR